MAEGGNNQEQVDYGPHDDDTFDVWVELGALNPDEQRFFDFSPIKRYEKKLKSSSPEANKLIRTPLDALMADEIPGVTPDSCITTTVFHHERGLNKRIIRAVISVEQSSGNVDMTLEKETW
jgi:hypothetical protein